MMARATFIKMTEKETRFKRGQMEVWMRAALMGIISKEFQDSTPRCMIKKRESECLKTLIMANVS